MRPGLAVMGMVALGAAVAANACSEHACSLVGCTDAFSANVRRADGSFPSGTHRIDVVADGASLTCTFTFPLPANTQPACPAPLAVAVSPATACTEVTTGSSSGMTCTPIPGQFVETITLMGTPAQVQAQQYVDDAPILDEMIAPTYQIVAPNGSECGPVCRQASPVDWTLQ
jgi:hypothetical protein